MLRISRNGPLQWRVATTQHQYFHLQPVMWLMITSSQAYDAPVKYTAAYERDCPHLVYSNKLNIVSDASVSSERCYRLNPLRKLSVYFFRNVHCPFKRGVHLVTNWRKRLTPSVDQLPVSAQLFIVSLGIEVLNFQRLWSDFILHALCTDQNSFCTLAKEGKNSVYSVDWESNPGR